jgi:hypothetical protein
VAMFAPRWLCVYPPPLLACVSPTAKSFVSPTYIKSARKSFASPTYADSGGWGSEISKQRATTSSITFNCPRRRPIFKTRNHYRFSHLSNKCRRADIPVSGIAPFYYFLFPTVQFPFASHALASLKPYNCELTTTLSARRHSRVPHTCDVYFSPNRSSIDASRCLWYYRAEFKSGARLRPPSWRIP